MGAVLAMNFPLFFSLCTEWRAKNRKNCCNSIQWDFLITSIALLSISVYNVRGKLDFLYEHFTYLCTERRAKTSKRRTCCFPLNESLTFKQTYYSQMIIIIYYICYKKKIYNYVPFANIKICKTF